MVFHRLPVLRGANSNKDRIHCIISKDNTFLSDLDALEEAHNAKLESIRLSGYRFLKPPGVSKTLKVMHEEESYLRDMSYYSSQRTSNSGDHNVHSHSNEGGTTEEDPAAADFNFMSQLGRHIHLDPEISYASSFVGEIVAENEDFSESELSNSDGMNASFPSMYHRRE